MIISLENDVKEAEGIIEVAVGVLIREDGKMLLSSRPAGKPYEGYWEFPGGKVEAGEDIADALARELKEELGITVNRSTPWFAMEHIYPHGHVRLHFRKCRDFLGPIVAREGQTFDFFAGTQHTPGPLLPMDARVMNRVDLPEVYEPTKDILCLTTLALHATIVRDRKYRWVGARVADLNDAMKARAMDFDFIIVPATDFDAVLLNGEAILPTIVEGASAADLIFWQERGAHGVAP